MSALTDRIAAEHRSLWSNATCGCGFEPVWSEDYGSHIATVTEAAVREQVAQDIGVLADECQGHSDTYADAAREAYAATIYRNAARIARGEQ